MEIVRKKIDIIFNEEEKQALKKVINILEQIEIQPEEVMNDLREQYEDYKIYDSDDSLIIAIDYLSYLMNYCKD